MIVCIVAVAVVLLFGVLIYKGKLVINDPEKLGYTIKGVDVSEYQGEIDWQTLSNEGIQFAFIKATEGSSYVDTYFKDNFQNAQDTNLKIGVYHFFSFESSGKTQAENFIQNVPIAENTLPSVVDVELYGEFKDNPLDKDTVVTELSTMLTALEDYYGVKPIIYTTHKAYKLYIKDNFSDYSIWFRDVYFYHSIKTIPNVDFWQYSSSAILNGYYGDEQHIDMNVFCGSQEDFNQY
jgi:lysozyme